MDELPTTSSVARPTKLRSYLSWSVALIIVIAAGWISWRHWFHKVPVAPSLVSTNLAGDINSSKTVLFRTPGGLLEVAGLKRTEEFQKDVNSWRGHSISSIQLEATYRYSVELPKELSVSIDQNVARVVMPNFTPELPVAFDTNTLKEKADEGWLRFDGKELLGSLKQDLSKQLTEKASSEVYRTLARETARQTLKEFISLRIIQDKDWLDDPKRILEVKFQDEVDAAEKRL